MGYIEYKYAKWKALPLGVTLLIPGIYFTYLIFINLPEFALLLFLFVLFTFVLLPLNLIIISLLKPFNLRIAKDAITDNSSFISYGTIPWGHIKSVTFGGSGHFRDWNNYLKIYLIRSNKLLGTDKNKIKTLFLRMRLRSDKKIMIPITLLNKSYQDIEKEIRRFIQENNIVLGRN